MNTTRVFLLSAFCILFLNLSYTQEFSDTKEKRADSIVKLLPYQTDSTLLKSYMRLLRLYDRKDPVKVKLYLYKAKELAKTVNNVKLKADLALTEGNYHWSISEYKESKDPFFKALEYYKLAKDSFQVAAVHLNLGVAHKNLGETSQAIDAYLKSLEMFKALNTDEKKLMSLYNNLGVIYAKMGNLKVSNEYYEKIESIAQEVESDFWFHLARSNRATNLVETKNYKEALEFYLNAIPYFEKYDRKLFLGEQHCLIGALYLEMDSLQKAVVHLDKSMKLSNETGETAMLGMAQGKMGEVHFKEGAYRSALAEFQKSLEISKQTENNIEIVNDYLHLSETYEKLGNLPKAYENHKLYFAMYDSVFSLESKQKLTDLEIKYKTEKSEQEVKIKEKEIVVLEQEAKISDQQKWLLGGGMGLSLVALGFGFYGFRQRTKRNKLEKDKVEAELEFKKKELTAHALHLAKKNEVLEGLKQKAAELKNTEGGGQAYQELIRTINFDQQDDKAWENFTRYFEAVHKDFEKVAVSRYPDISKNEIRLMALLKMNLSSKEIANILNISAVGVKKARNRLRKKMQLTPEDSLETMIMSI